MSSTWSEDDIAVLNEMIATKKSFSKIAKILNRSVLAVKYKYGRMYRKKAHRKITVMSYSDSGDSGDSGDSSDITEEKNVNLDEDDNSEEYPHVHKKHRRTMSDESDPSIYIKYSPKESSMLSIVCTVFITLVVTLGTCRFVTTLFDSLGKVNYVT